jgi:hypothetical protein
LPEAVKLKRFAALRLVFIFAMICSGDDKSHGGEDATVRGGG